MRQRPRRFEIVSFACAAFPMGRLMAVVASACVCATLVACANSHAANAENFTAAIDKHLAAGGAGANACLSISLPASNTVAVNAVAVSPSDPEKFDVVDPDTMKQLDVLVAGGTVQKHREAKTDDRFGGPFKLMDDVYDLAPDVKSQVGSYDGQHLCFATLKVGSIEKFTEPSSAMGMTVSEVTYTPAVANLSDWAQGVATLDLTNNGWEVAQGSSP
jgi:hypothetical protein